MRALSSLVRGVVSRAEMNFLDSMELYFRNRPRLMWEMPGPENTEVARIYCYQAIVTPSDSQSEAQNRAVLLLVEYYKDGGCEVFCATPGLEYKETAQAIRRTLKIA